jgi:hypothetical protein
VPNFWAKYEALLNIYVKISNIDKIICNIDKILRAQIIVTISNVDTLLKFDI